MRVLIVASYLHNDNWIEFTRNKTGFGIMLNDIVYSVSELVNVQFVSHVITPGRGRLIAKHTWIDVFRNLQLKDVMCGLKGFFQYPQSFINRARNVYYNLNRGYVRNKIHEYNPDVVHIHGIGHNVLPYIEVCEEMRVPYVVSLHGLIGLDESIKAPQWDKAIEKEFLIKADREAIPVTVISTGIKHRIEENYLHHKAKNIYVVCNGTHIPGKNEISNNNASEASLDLRKQFHLLPKEKIAVTIGTVYENKNQIQIVRAVATGIIKVPCRFFFCGTVLANSFVQQEIDKHGLNNNIYLLGFVPKHQIASLLEQADLNILVSKNEGFGLSIIEAYAHGVPTVTFSDLDAVPDLYNPKTMIKVESREDIALANGIEEGLKKKWDKKDILVFAKKFSLEQMAKEYVKIYTSVLLEPKSRL
jgi:glycosyltransferase involved in cell wall biosynthesis